MKITEDKWEKIVAFRNKTNLIAMIGSVDSVGQANVTPIGALILKDDSSGFYFDLFTKKLSDNLDQNNKVCVLFVQTGKLIWLKSMVANKSKSPAGIKLIGTAGNKRKASEEEVALLRNKIKYLKKLKGYQTIFGNLSYVRDITFTDYFMLNIGKMTFHL